MGKRMSVDSSHLAQGKKKHTSSISCNVRKSQKVRNIPLPPPPRLLLLRRHHLRHRRPHLAAQTVPPTIYVSIHNAAFFSETRTSLCATGNKDSYQVLADVPSTAVEVAPKFMIVAKRDIILNAVCHKRRDARSLS